MTDKEFNNLKPGDKVWIITDWLNKSNEGMKAVQIEVSAKDNEAETIKFIGGAFNRDFCFLTKAEAWEREIASFETHLEYREEGLKRDRQELERYKSELAKAKEEEEVYVWVVDFDEGRVDRSTKRRWEGSVENYEWSSGSPRYKPCETEREAYESLAKYYLEKFYETRRKAEETK